jgi:sugar-specific transcriptional regulator TrmB
VNSPEVQKLVALGFVTVTNGPDNSMPGTPVAVDPRQAARRRAVAELEDVQNRIAAIKALPELSDRLSDLYERGQWRAGAGSEYIDDVTTVNARLDHVVAGAREEILAAQPGGPRNRVQLNRSLDRDQAALDRGVRMRTLYRDTVRDSAAAAEYARVMTGRSAAYRTLVGHFERAIIVDRRVAFVPNHIVPNAPDHSAWLITDRAMIAYIVAEFEEKWRRADPWMGELRTRGATGVDTVSGPAQVRTTRRQREILRDIAVGKEQRVTATRLGIGLRTLTGEINALKALFDASSLPELTYKWALSPDRLVDDSAPADEAGADGVENAA